MDVLFGDNGKRNTGEVVHLFFLELLKFCEWVGPMFYGVLHAEITKQKSPVKLTAHDLMDFTPSIFKLSLDLNSRWETYMDTVLADNVCVLTWYSLKTLVLLFESDIQFNKWTLRWCQYSGQCVAARRKLFDWRSIQSLLMFQSLRWAKRRLKNSSIAPTLKSNY